MPRTVKDARLDSREARSRLSRRSEPHWRTIDQGRHLGYYRGARSGSWIARYRPVDGGPYRKKRLGVADDVQDADGHVVLSFRQAQEQALAWFQEQARVDSGDPADTGPYTVEKAITEYLDDYRSRGRSLRDVQYRVDAFVIPALGQEDVRKLTAPRVRRWHQDLAKAPARLRTKKGKPQRHRELVDDDRETERKRRHSANKVLTILKAALNHAWREGRVPSDKAWRRVAPFKKVDLPRLRILSDDELRRLVNACSRDFRPLVQAALLTGCRYAELANLRAADLDRGSKTILISHSKSGQPRRVYLTDEGLQFFGERVAGLDAEERILKRADGGAWGKSHQSRPLASACAAANIRPAISFHILRHCYASRLAMAGTPMRVIADQLGHADTRIAERHYAHLLPNYIGDTVRSNFSELGIVETSTVVPMRPSTAGGKRS